MFGLRSGESSYLFRRLPISLVLGQPAFRRLASHYWSFNWHSQLPLNKSPTLHLHDVFGLETSADQACAGMRATAIVFYFRLRFSDKCMLVLPPKIMWRKRTTCRCLMWPCPTCKVDAALSPFAQKFPAVPSLFHYSTLADAPAPNSLRPAILQFSSSGIVAEDVEQFSLWPEWMAGQDTINGISSDIFADRRVTHSSLRHPRP